jgi:hypothetical protein
VVLEQCHALTGPKVTALAGLLTLALATGCGVVPVPAGPAVVVPEAAPTVTVPADPPGPVPADDAAGPAPAGTGTDAASALAALPVKGRAPRAGYARDRFGPAWADIDRDGCDQRNQVLARDMTGETFKPRTHGCVVLTGRLADPYTGRQIAFRRGNRTSEAVQIDHVVALSNAWQTGAAGLDPATLARLANDPLNLLAVDGPTNQGKGDGDAATWLPPNKAYRCAYVSRQVAVKARYRLWVTPAERSAIAGVLARCPGQPLVTG